MRAALFQRTEPVVPAVGDALKAARFMVLGRTMRSLLIATAAVALGCMGGLAANAASLQWSADGVTPGGGGTGTWNTTTALWYNGTSFQTWSNAPVNDAVFSGTAGTVTLGVAITVENLTFNTSGYTITGNTLTLGGVTPTISVVAGGTATIGSIIAGAVGLTQAGGTGTLILTGANTYSGGTTISAGTLQIGNGATGSVAGNITDNAALVFDRNNALTYAGVISGSGSLTQTGTGTLTLTGANTYSGGTTISAGTLQIGAGATGSVVGNITDNAALVINRTGALSYAGVISGTGSLTSSGAGTVTLTGANTYSGVTTISAGTLQAGATNTFSSASAFTVTGTLDLNGFNQTIGSLAGAGTVTNAGGTVATLTAGGNNTSTTFSGVMQDGTSASSLTKTGSGTLTLTGANTYSGGTTISA